MHTATNTRTRLLADSWAAVSIGVGIATILASAGGWPGLLWSPLGVLVAYVGVATSRELRKKELIIGNGGDGPQPLTQCSTVASGITVVVATLAFRWLHPGLAAATTYGIVVLIVGVCFSTRTLERSVEFAPPRGRLLAYAWVKPLWSRARDGIEPFGYALQLLLTLALGSAYLLLWLLVEAVLPVLDMINRYVWRGAIAGDATRAFARRATLAIGPAAVCGGIGAGIAATLAG